MAQVNARLFQILDQFEAAFKLKNFTYARDDEKFMISSNIKGDDLNIELKIIMDRAYERFQIISFLPFKTKEEDFAEMCKALNYVNYLIYLGKFSMDFKDGVIQYEMSAAFKHIDVNPEYLRYLIDISIGTINVYNGKLFGVSKRMLNVEGLKKMIEGE